MNCSGLCQYKHALYWINKFILCFPGLSNLTSLSFKRSNAITAEGMRAFANLVNLVKLDLERCLKIHGGVVHLKGLFFGCPRCISTVQVPLIWIMNTNFSNHSSLIGIRFIMYYTHFLTLAIFSQLLDDTVLDSWECGLAGWLYW